MRILTLVVCVLTICNLVPMAQAIWLTLPSWGPKCDAEEILLGIVVLADYVVISEDHPLIPTVSVKVTSPYGNVPHHVKNATNGRFAFTTNEAGSYEACFWLDGHNQGGGEVSVNIDWKIGIRAKDWESVAKKEEIQGVELELRKLEGSVYAIYENLLCLKGREAEMRHVSDKTNSRVAWYCIISVGVCIAVSSLQLWHLRRFFHKKRLI